MCAQISESFDVTVWVNNHQMHVDCFVACLLMDSKAFRKRCSEQNAVHDVNVEPVGFTFAFIISMSRCRFPKSAARTEGA
jgi:hypothetical protein